MISIVICTHNRAELLQDAVSSFSKMHGLKDIAHELLVIDNNSTDSTRKVIENFSKIKTLRYVFEEKLGLSYARNRGIRESSGEIIAYVDDDILFGEWWLSELRKGIKKWPDAVVYGGKTVPRWERVKPLWFVDDGYFSMRGYIAHLEPNIPEGYMQNFPYGCNMAFRRSALKNLEFDGKLGRKGRMLLSSEEWDLFFEIRKSGGKFIYLPDAGVVHRITRERGEKRYYLKRIKISRKSIVHMHMKHSMISQHVLGIPLSSIKILIKAPLMILKDALVFRDTNRFFSYRIRLLEHLWYIRLFRKNLWLTEKKNK
jgi:glycosyltransferase involved in cell wall biosynthesis